MKHVTQKINLMSSLTGVTVISEKILDSSSMKDKEMKKIINSNSKKSIFSKKH